jgi:hypothetical protein
MNAYVRPSVRPSICFISQIIDHVSTKYDAGFHTKIYKGEVKLLSLSAVLTQHQIYVNMKWNVIRYYKRLL